MRSSTRIEGRLGLLLLLTLCVACSRKPKRVLRTEPWPAPAVSASSGSATTPGQPVRYEITNATLGIELPARKAKPAGKFTVVKGSIELDPQELTKTRAHIEVDLLSLTLADAKKAAEDPALLARAFDWLELSAEQDREAREVNRYAKLEVSAFEPVRQNDDAPRAAGATRVVAHGELTLHRFRVPVVLDLEVDLGGRGGKDRDVIKIRTRRPLLVSLAAHDILPRDARGTLLTKELPRLGNEVGRDARISAELEARPARNDAAKAGGTPQR